MRKRGGFSLVECLIAISLMAVVFSTIAVAMSGLRRCSRRIREESQVELDLERFSSQLRADAHLALSVDLEDSADPGSAANTLLLTLTDERSVRYTLQARSIQRVLRQGEEPRHRETYRLPPSCTAHWQVDVDRPSPMVSLRIDPGAADSTNPFGFQAMRIDAAVGLLRASLTQHNP